MDRVSKPYLILVCQDFPFGRGESFLETEIEYLADSFQSIFIISNNLIDSKSREVPENVVVFRCAAYHNVAMKKLMAIRYVFTVDFWKEILFIKNNLEIKLSFAVVKVILSTFQDADKVALYIENVIKENAIPSERLVLYSYWYTNIALAVAKVKRRVNAKFAFARAHNWDIYFERNPSEYLPLRVAILSGLDKLFLISNHGKGYLISKLKLTEKRQLIAKLEISKLGTKRIAAVNKRIEPSGKLRLLSCSTIYPVKRVDLIIEGLSSIEHVSVEWTHIGWAFNPEYEIYIESLAKEKLGKKLNIFYEFRGAIPNQKVHGLLSDNCFDVFINLSTYEGIPVSIMEAMSYGLPVIATDVCGNAEIVNVSNGILISADPKPSEVASAISQISNLGLKERNDLSAASTTTWRTQYNAEKNYPEFLSKIIDNAFKT